MEQVLKLGCQLHNADDVFVFELKRKGTEYYVFFKQKKEIAIAKTEDGIKKFAINEKVIKM